MTSFRFKLTLSAHGTVSGESKEEVQDRLLTALRECLAQHVTAEAEGEIRLEEVTQWPTN